MTTLVFEKMHGLGNDFMLIDNRQQEFSPTATVIQQLANRHTGIGFDQLLLIEHSSVDQCDAAYRFFNPDGSEAQQCGNGQRCLSHYLHSKNPQQRQFRLSGLAGIMSSEVLPDGQVKVNMGPIQSLHNIDKNDIAYQHIEFGNPHAVVEVDAVDDCDLVALNDQFNEFFPQGINLEIVETIDQHTIKIRVHERGTGETLACGSGACASAYALLHNHQVQSPTKVILPGGNLMVEYDQQHNCLYLTGAATHVFTGNLML